MNKNKIDPSLLEVSMQSKGTNQKVIISSNDYFELKKELDNAKLKYTSFPFIKSFSVTAPIDKILNFSNHTSVQFISKNCSVEAKRTETDIMNLENLTLGKFLGQGVTICFIDTGIINHFDFIFPTNRIIKFVDLINNKNVPYDDNGHGSFVAGICAGNGIVNSDFSGFAPLSNIIVIKALNEKGTADSNIILDAMQWIYENHKAFHIDIVCMSLGADTNNEFDPLTKGAEVLWKKGITIVAAAGNSGPSSSSIKSPGNCPYIITVGGIDVKTMSVADFSSRGPTIYGHKPDLIAPSVDVIACNNKFEPYVAMSGTSVATPIVAGICACIKSRFRDATNNDIKKFLLNHCEPITNNKDIEGSGFLNFKNLKI